MTTRSRRRIRKTRTTARREANWKKLLRNTAHSEPYHSEPSTSPSPTRNGEMSYPFTLQPVTISHQPTKHGVRFNVIDVQPSTSRLPTYNREETNQILKEKAKRFHTLKDYNLCRDGTFIRPQYQLRKEAELEASSVPADTLLKCPADSFALVALIAFARHYPLILRPDDIWSTIAFGAVKHIEKNSEALRDRFVSFQGKKKIEIEKHDAVLGHVPKDEWERDVFALMSSEIRSHIGSDVHDLFTAPFSTSTKTDQAVSEITLMGATKSFFYGSICTLCGIPWIELEGSEEDWVLLRKRAERLEQVLLPNFGKKWLTYLLPVLDEFVQSYRGNVDHGFWQRMVKEIPADGNSGSVDRMSGWMNVLYPFLGGGEENKYMKAWQEMDSMHGPPCSGFAGSLSSAPIVWKYYETEYPLHFHAGNLGMRQDGETLALRPLIGWFVSHDPK